MVHVLFKHIFLNKGICILNDFSLKFVPKGPIDDNTSLFHVMAWYQIGYKPLPKPMCEKSTVKPLI